MAKPAFIYAFDNLGPEKFAEVCGFLLASRYRGFLLGGIGPDGGIDSEIDEILGEWNPEAISPLLNEVIGPGNLVVFQFKHKVTSRVGQSKARSQLLSLYECQSNKKCELHRDLIVQRQPNTYVLVSNVEVNSQFRATFIDTCKRENPDIDNYQIIGLDELETWVTMEHELRHLYFPTIFGPPRFSLRVQVTEGAIGYEYYDGTIDFSSGPEVFQVMVFNVGTVPSYVGSISFKAIVDGEQKYFSIPLGTNLMRIANPKPGTAIEPGRKHIYHFPFEVMANLKEQGKDIFLVDVLVGDEIGNVYNAPIPEHLKEKILSYKMN